MCFFIPSSWRPKKSSFENKIFIRDFLVETEVGVFDAEKGIKQRLILGIEVVPKSWPNPTHDNIDETVSYDHIVQIVHEILKAHGHIHLLETVADVIAAECLTKLPIRTIRVKVEKPDIYGFAVPGIEIMRNA